MQNTLNLITFKAHIKTVHSTVKTYNCPEKDCNRSFATMDHYTKHQKTHLNIRKYECKECDMKFLQKWYVSTVFKIISCF